MEEHQAVLAALEKARLGTLRRLDRLTQAQLDWQPATVEGKREWSLGEVFMHLAMDEIYVRELVARPLLEGVKPPEAVRFLPPPPPMATPKAAIRFWFERARMGTRRFIAGWPPDPNLDITHEGGLEEMNGLQWLRGYAGHEIFHHQQIDGLIARLPDEDLS